MSKKTTYGFRIYVTHIPYRGPPTPSTVHEWIAYCLDPIPTVEKRTIDIGCDVRWISFSPPERHGIPGDTREAAIANMKKYLGQCIVRLRELGITIEQEEVTIEV